MNRLTEIAMILGELYPERIDANIHKSHIESDLAARIVVMTPLDGWPGKNQEQRELAKDLQISTDDACAEMQSILRDIDNELGDINGEIEALEAERRALEWTIRGRLAEALSGRRNGHGPVEEEAFDDAADNEATEAVENEIRHDEASFVKVLTDIDPEDMPF